MLRIKKMSTKKKSCELLLMFMISCSGIEIPDNQGKEFFIGFMEADKALKGNLSELPLKLFITTASQVPVSVNVSAPMSRPLYTGNNFTVQRGIIKQILIPKTLRLQGTERSKKAIHVKSSDEIVLFGINQADMSTDGFLGIPSDVLGTKYFVPTFSSNRQHFFQSAILVVGTQDGTMLNIRLPSNNSISIHLEGNHYNRDDWINTTINRFDTLQLRCHGDLSGTLVLSSNKISVFGGSTVTSIGTGWSRDHIEEQIPPVNVWGKKFAVNPFPDTNPNILRILASEDNTAIAINNKNPVYLMNGKFHETKVRSFSYVSSNKPVLSVQYVPSGTCNNTSQLGCHKGDPAMTLIPPIEQSNIFYSFLTPLSSHNVSFDNTFMFFIEDSYENGILLDNKAPKQSDFKSIVHSYNLTAGYIQIPHGSHTIEHSSRAVPIGGILYGGIHAESYAFPVGQRFATINERECHPLAMHIGDGLDNDCDGHVDEEICYDRKDNDGDGRKDEDCSKALKITTKTATLATRSTITSLPTTSSTTTPASTTTFTTTATTRPTSIRTTTTTQMTAATSTTTPTTTQMTTTTTSTTPSTTTQKTTTTTSTTPSTTTQKTTTTTSTTPSTKAQITTTTTSATPPLTLSTVHQHTQISEDPQRPTWISYIEYGIIGGVSLVVIGALGVCCKKCFGLLAKRDEDEEEEYRRKMNKKARQTFGAPAIRPMYI